MKSEEVPKKSEVYHKQLVAFGNNWQSQLIVCDSSKNSL